MQRQVQLALLLFLVCCASIVHASRHVTPSLSNSSLPCGIGGLDFSSLSGAGISTSDWALYNFYIQICAPLQMTPNFGPLKRGLCSTAQDGWENASVCRVNQFEDTSVSMGRWDENGEVTWSIIGEGEREDGLAGASLSLNSGVYNCTDDAGASSQPFSLTLSFLCDPSYPTPGPIDIDQDSDPCHYDMSMRTVLACNGRHGKKEGRIALE